MLTADQAAEVAKRAGLSIADAAAIRALADDMPTAERIAAKFSASDDAAERAAVRDLFGERNDTSAAKPNDGTDDERALVKALFGARTTTTDTTE